MERLLLGIDIGSSAVKAATYTADGEQVELAREECPSTAEVDPEVWWAATRAVLNRLDTSRVLAVGVCGRGGTCVLVDDHGRVLAPSWHDGRSAELASELRADCPGLSPQSLTLLAKARWWERNHHERVAVAFSAKDFITWRLTGAVSSDPASGGDSSGHGRPLVQALLPWDAAGRTSGASALPQGIPVAVGWHDGAAAAFGAGAAESHAAPVTLGTTAVFRVVTQLLPSDLRKYWDLTPGLTVTGGDITGAGMAYAWAKQLLPTADAGHSPPGARGVTFLPQFAGRIAPDRNPGARGAWWGMTGDESADDLLRAVIEGTAFSLRQVRDWLSGHGLRADRIVTTGGGSRNPLQVQVLADVLRQDILVTGVEEGCRGAALLGGVAAGALTVEEARLARPAYTTVRHERSNGDAYDEPFRRFVTVQAALDSVVSGERP